MKATDLSVIVRSVVPVVREYVEASLRGIREDVKALHERPAPKDGAQGPKGDPGEPGSPGKDADAAIIATLQTEIESLRSELAHAKDFSETYEARVITLITAAIDARAGAALFTPVDIQTEVAKQMNAMLPAEVERAVAAMPVPKDGQSVTVEDVAPVIAAEVERAVALIPTPKDGVGLLSAVIDREGRLLLTITDGSTKDLGVVVGRDADIETTARLIQAELDKWPRPKDGAPGVPGRDGTLENIKVERRSERVIEFCFKDGTPVEGGLIRLNHPVPRGTHVRGQEYEEGDVVTWSGSTWIAHKTTRITPGEGKPEITGWHKWVHKGAEGKSGPKGDPGERGPRGEMGPQGRSF